MPSKVRIISGPADKSWDHFIQDIINGGKHGVEHIYFGIRDQDRADLIRRKIRQSGRHMDPPVAVKAFWTPCGGCQNGGADCGYHVSYTVFNMDEARAYKQATDTLVRQNSA